MKNYRTYIFFSLLILMSFRSTGQQTLSHQSQSPPINPGYTFTRGIFVDCAEDIIIDISNRNLLGLEQGLIDYLRANYISYIILRGLDQSSVFNRHSLLRALRLLMTDLKQAIPGIKIGICGSEEGTFQPTPDITISPAFGNSGFPVGTISSVNDFKLALNDAGVNQTNLKRSELCKFFFRAAALGYEFPGQIKDSRPLFSFDALYLEYRYWNHTSSLVTMQNEFTNYKSLLSVMQILKNKFQGITSVDAEFVPSGLFTLQAWTAIDQITEADPLADRLLIPATTNDGTAPFNLTCKLLHYLSDRFSKPNSKIFIGLNAESSAFHYCNSTNSPQDNLGDYLNGTVMPSGNLYSVEKYFIDKFNDPIYVCPACGCRPYIDDHYSLSNTSGNTLVGTIWGPYSMMKQYNLFKIAGNTDNTDISDKKIKMIKLLDITGRTIKNLKSIEEFENIQLNNNLMDGIYFLTILSLDGKTEIRKIFLSKN